MAESITEGTLSQFSKSVGDFIEMDEELATIETDKIDVSVNATQAGIIQQLLVAEGDVVTVDQVIAEIQPGQKQPESQVESEASEPVPKQTNSQHDPTNANQSSTPPTTEQTPADSPELVRETLKDATIPKKEVPPAQPTEASSVLQGIMPSRAEEKVTMRQPQRSDMY